MQFQIPSRLSMAVALVGTLLIAVIAADIVMNTEVYLAKYDTTASEPWYTNLKEKIDRLVEEGRLSQLGGREA